MAEPAVFHKQVPTSVGGGTRIFVAVTLGPLLGMIAGLVVDRYAPSLSWGAGIVVTFALGALVVLVQRGGRMASVTVSDDRVELKSGETTASMSLENIATIGSLGASVILTSVTAETLVLPTNEVGALASEIKRRLEAHPKAAELGERLAAREAAIKTILLKPAYATNAILIMMVGAFALEWASGALESLPMMVRLGGNARQLLLDGQLNRLIVASFLHGSLLHVAMNTSSMATLSSQLEKFVGWSRLVPVVFVSAVLGMLFAALINDGVIVGMSTGAYGLLGAAAVTTYTFRHHRLDGIWLSRSQWVRLAVINGLINLVPSVSAAGHLGGFIGGALTAIVVLPRPGQDALLSERAAKVLSSIAIALTLAAVIATAIQASS